MPTVRYSDRRVETGALPGVRGTAAETETSAGVGLAEAQARSAQQLGNVGANIAQAGGQLWAAQQRERQRANDVQVMASDTALGKWEYQRIYDPDKGAYTVKGKDAMGLPDQIATEFDQVAGEIERGLTNDDQRREFAKIKAQRALNLYGNISRHVSQEVERYHAQEVEAKVENGIELAVANATDPRRVEDEAKLVVGAIKSAGKSFGWGEEQTKQRVGNALSAIHVGVVENLLDNRKVTEAREHYEESKALITDVKQRSRIEGMLKTAGVLEESQTLADTIIAEGGTVDEQLEKARKRATPEAREHTEARIEHVDARKRQAEQQSEANDLDKAYNLVRTGTQVRDLPPTMLEHLGAHIPALENYAQQKAKGEPTITDQTTFYNLMMQAANHPDQFASDALNLLKYRDRLSDSDFQQLTSLKANLISGNRKAAVPKIEEFQTKNQVLDSVLATYNIDPTPKDGTPEADAIGQLRGMMDRRLEALTKEGQPVTNTEIADVLHGLLSVNQTVPGSWWNVWPGGKPFYDSTKRLVDIKATDIPAATRTRIEQAMQTLGLPVTDATVRDYYIEWQLEQRAKAKRR